MKIKHYMLKNIQSWGEKSKAITLAPNKMNVLIAPSETGKSVIVKIIKEMCFAGNWGYTWDSLIRRGCEFGAVAFVLEDETIVSYHIWRNKVRYAIVYKGDVGHIDNKAWVFTDKNHTEIPDEIANAMGLVIDRKGKTVINVLDKDMVTPYVTAPPELNARISSVITVVPEMEIRRNNLEIWKEQLTLACKNVDRLYNEAYSIYNQAPEIDVLDYKIKLNMLENFARILEPIEHAYQWLSTYNYPNKPIEVKCPNIDKLINIINIISDILKIGDILSELHEPKFVAFDVEQVENIVNCIKNVDDISLLVNKILTLHKPKQPVDEINLDNAKTILDTLNHLANYGKSVGSYLDIKIPSVILEPPLQINTILLMQKYLSRILFDVKTVLYLEKPVFKVNMTEVDTLMNMIHLLKALNIDAVISYYDKLDDYTYHVVCSEKEIDSIRKEMGVCPTCGKPW